MSTATSLSVRALLNSAIAQDRPRRPRARLLGPDAAGQGAGGGRGRARRARRGRAVRRARPMPSSRPPTSDVRFFLSALEALSDAVAERVVLPFPSHQVDPYRGLAPHFRVASARARALHAAALGTARVIVASAQALLPRLPAPESVLTTSFDLRPGVEIEPHGAGRDPRRAAATSGRIRSTSTASSRCAAASSTCFPPAKRRRSASSSSATRSNRSAGSIPARSDRSRRSISFRSSRSAKAEPRRRSGAGEPRHVAATSTVFDYLRASRHDAHRRRRARGRARAGREVVRAGPGVVRAAAERQDAAATASAGRPSSCCCRGRDLEPHSRAAPSTPRGAARVDDAPAQARRRCTSRRSRRRSSAAAFPTGSPRSARRAIAAKRSCSSPARTAAPSAPWNCCTTTRCAPCSRPKPTSASRAPCSSPKDCCRGLPPARRRRFRSTPRPTSSRKSAAGRRRSRKRSLAATFLSDLRDLKVGDSSSTSITASASSSA